MGDLVANALVSPGCRIRDAHVRNSIIRPDVVLLSDSVVVHSILLSGVRVGQGVRVSRAIVDKHGGLPRLDEMSA